MTASKAVALTGLLWSAVATAELQPESLGTVERLPVPYPAHWIVVHDAAFFHMLEGKMVVLDPEAETGHEQYKGMFNSSFIGHFTQATSRPEMYVAETFYSRGNRGERTDVVTIYDKAHLAPVSEVVLPGGKRASSMPEKYGMQLIDNERLLLVYNFTPATSVSVVDIERREFLHEIPLPGCALIYPTGKRGFSALCSDGGMYSAQLDRNGKVASQHRLDPFFDVHADPLFEKPAMIDGVAHFPSFLGKAQPVDLRGAMPVALESWPLVSAEERKQGWRPGGLQLIAADAGGNMYLLMHPEGRDGSHKDGGPEVWVFDVEKKKRQRRIELKTWGISIALTQDEAPLLLVTNADMNIDVYQAANGSHVRTLAGFGQETPFVIYPAR